ncbi:hypothetical protein [Microbacterium sp. LWH3-1.2]|uniref:hypothetical protein n=1 Tax=Microbacterium sp. LWH3-1.2 TaxID=3135256 RepID=UPI0034204E7B
MSQRISDIVTWSMWPSIDDPAHVTSARRREWHASTSVTTEATASSLRHVMPLAPAVAVDGPR